MFILFKLISTTNKYSKENECKIKIYTFYHHILKLQGGFSINGELEFHGDEDGEGWYFYYLLIMVIVIVFYVIDYGNCSGIFSLFLWILVSFWIKYDVYIY